MKTYKTVAKIRPLGTQSPYFWGVEPVDGCNLKCGHCSCALNVPGQYHFMTEETWRSTFQVINAVTPYCRVDLNFAGEPTLHPRLTEFLSIARKLCPNMQLQITTNGTMLRVGKVKYRDLLAAGANIIYTDMYGTKERFFQLAEESGEDWYEYYNKPEGAPSPWTYWGPQVRMIVLQENPSNWPESRKRAGLLGTWLNHLDWEAAKPFGMKPVTEPIHRRCNQPFILVGVKASGDYVLCCQDSTGETAGMLGNVREGVEGFKRFWFGKMMQQVRFHLRNKDRGKIPYCAKCNITFSRCDFKHWTDEQVGKYWDGSQWRETFMDGMVIS